MINSIFRKEERVIKDMFNTKNLGLAENKRPSDAN